MKSVHRLEGHEMDRYDRAAASDENSQDEERVLCPKAGRVAMAATALVLW